jgi:hypothetical protein
VNALDAGERRARPITSATPSPARSSAHSQP